MGTIRRVVAAAVVAVILPAVLSGCDGGHSPEPDEQAAPVSVSFPSIGYGFSLAEVVEGLDQPSGVAVSADGSRLFLSGGNGEASGIARLDDDTDTVTWLGTELEHPGLIATSPDGLLYAIDQEDDDLHVSSDQGSTWRAIPAATGGFSGSQAVAARDGLVVVTNGDDDSLAVSTDTGETWRRIDKGAGLFAGVAGVVIDRAGRILVLDSSDGGISVSADQGSSWRKIDGTQTGLVAPLAIAVGPSDELVVTDPGAGGLARSIDGGETWTSTAGFENAFGVAIDGKGLVYVTDDQFSLVKLTAVPGLPKDVRARWGQEPGTVEVSWERSGVTGGADLTGQTVSILLDPSSNGGGADDHDSPVDDSTSPSPAPSESGPTFEWDEQLAPDIERTTMTGITPGVDVLVTVIVTNAAGASAPKSVRLTADADGGSR